MSWKYKIGVILGAAGIMVLADTATAAELVELRQIQEISGNSLIIDQLPYKLSDRLIIHPPTGGVTEDTSLLRPGSRVHFNVRGSGSSVPYIEEIWVYTD